MPNYQLWALLPATIACLCVVGGVYLAMQMARQREAEHDLIVYDRGAPPRRPAPQRVGVSAASARRTFEQQRRHDHPVVERQEHRLNVANSVDVVPQTSRINASHGEDSSFCVPREQKHAVSSSSTPSVLSANSSPWRLAQEAQLQEQVADVAPRPQAREPLVVMHKLQYGRKLYKYTFQSDQRDIATYPTPSFYRIQLVVPLRNVIGIFMNSAVIPISEPSVNLYNQWIDIDVGGILYEVMVPEGDYSDGFSLAAGIQGAIQAMGGPLALFTVTYTLLTRTLTVNTNGAPCIIRWRTGPHVNRSMWIVMGFPREDTADLVVHVAPGIIDVAGPLALDVFIEEIKADINSTDNPFVRVNLQKFTPTSTITYFTPTEGGLPLTFWPIARLAYLTFSFMVKYTELLPDGQLVVKYRPYDFKERQHTFQLTVETKEYKNVFEDVVELDPQS